METQRIAASDPGAISRALEVLRQGGLVAFPTDTVYGVGVSAFDPLRIEQLFVVKGREAGKAIAVLLGSPADLPRVTAGMNPLAARLAERFWPGPLTLVVSRHPGLPEILSPQPTIGVRMPDHPVALELLRRAGPLATTSANLSGRASPVTAQEVLEQLGGRIDLVLDGGQTPGGVASTVADCTGPAPIILRQGPLSLEDLLAVG
jgi:L-threonylcarbamoyladenylate synthase